MRKVWIYTILACPLSFASYWLEYKMGAVKLFALAIPYLLLGRWVAEKYGK
jgi:hypothetical protein